MPTERTSAVLVEVGQERSRQDELWGPPDRDWPMWIVILGEEIGEACRAVVLDDAELYRTELIHVAAVAVSAIECLDRRGEEAVHAD